MKKSPEKSPTKKKQLEAAKSQEMVKVQKFIKNPPNILAIHLKRFKPDFERRRFVKRSDKISYPLELDVSSYLHDVRSYLFLFLA